MPTRRGGWAAPIVVWLFLFTMLAVHVGEATGGMLPGIDDQMRFTQVQDLMSGQAWGTVDQSRLLTPEGGAMHWSRIPDVFLVGLTHAFSPILGAQQAAYAAAAIWPLILFVIASAALALILRRLGASPAGVAAGLACFALSASVYQFYPGRIDHHGLEVALLLVALASLLSPRRSKRSAVIAGIAVAAMLSVAIESLPYAAGIILSFGLLWVCRGGSEAQRLQVFGASSAIAAAFFYMVDAPGPGAARAACDAFGNAHLAAIIAAGAGFALLPRFNILTSPMRRFAGAASAGVVTVLAVLSAAPACVGDPYAAIDAELRYLWLDTVREAKSLWLLAVEDQQVATRQYGVVFAAAVALAVLVGRASPRRRITWTPIVVLFGLSVLATIWQVRGVTFSHALASIPAGVAVGAVFDRWRAVRGPAALIAAAAVAALLAPVTWRAVGDTAFAKTPTDAGAPIVTLRDCTAPDAADTIAQLRTLPVGKVFASIGIGTWVLVNSEHSVFNAPYHRNPKGIATGVKVFAAPPEDAVRTLGELGADYFAYCPGSEAMRLYARRWPDGFAARLEAGAAPDWLQPVGGEGDPDQPMRLFRIDDAEVLAAKR